MKSFSTLIIVIGLIVMGSMATAKSPEQGANPFANGTNERNLIVIFSDVHLGADLRFAETKKNLPNLVKFLDMIRTSPNVKELVIAGDLLDEWFVPATIDTYQGKDQLDFVRRIASSNKTVFDMFNKIIQEKKVKLTYVPGNHDLTIRPENVEAIMPGINQARDEGKIGLGTYSPDILPELAVEHGHRFNFFCAPDPISNKSISPTTITPPGYFFTRIGALHVMQRCKKSGEPMKIVTPNVNGGKSQELAYKYWQSWQWSVSYLPVNNKFDEKFIVTNVDGLTETYSMNDFIPYQTTPGGHIDQKLFKNIQDQWEERQTLNNVQVHISAEQAIDSVGSNTETDNEANIQFFHNPKSNKRIVVFGHTHQAIVNSSKNTNGKKCVYANSGSWIDRMDHGAAKDPNQGATEMNFIVITPQKANDSKSQTEIKLYNFEGGKANYMQGESLNLKD